MKNSRVDFRLYLITDRARLRGRPLVSALQEAAHAGVTAMQLREKDLSPRELYALADEARQALEPLGARLLINDRADIACAAKLAGVHLTTTSLSPAAARCCLPEDALVGVSTHTLAEARFAEAFGADFITFGPVFFTPSKAAYGEPQGLEQLRAICDAVTIPVFALGGITPERVPECLHAGAHGVAAIGALLDAPSITEAVAAFITALHGRTRTDTD
ncbi:MAG: thiamine phosphate synthase [Armatimonadota bacterium]